MRGRAGYPRLMHPSEIRGQHLEIVLADADRVLELDLEDDDPAVSSLILDAIEKDDPDEAESLLRTGAHGQVQRRSW
jgi:hypothetical protein